MEAIIDTIEPVQTIVANRPPAITWHHLKMNEVPIDLAATAPADADAVAFDVPSGFEFWEEQQAGAAQSVGNAGLRDAFDHARAAAGMQTAVETGMGPQASAWLAHAASRRAVVRVPADAAPAEPVAVRVTAQDGAYAVSLLDVVVEARSSIRIIVHTDSAGPGTGVVGSGIRVFAGPGAHVDLFSVQTMDAGWQYLDDTGVCIADDASVTVHQVVLGAAASYTGFAADLFGHRADCRVDTRYLGHGAQTIDFNYVMRQRGRKTTCSLTANGVLTDRSQKTLRGTIDLVHGCKGSIGRENETVLLASENVRNKTLPVILCDEDDVQGDHGATIGHVNPAQLAYMQSRGLALGSIEALFARAVFDWADANAPDAHIRTAVERLSETVLGSQAVTLEEGADR